MNLPISTVAWSIPKVRYVAMAAIALSVVAWLALDIWRFQQVLSLSLPAPTITESQASLAVQPLNIAAVASFLGIQQQAGADTSAAATPLTLLACFVESRQDLSRALIQSPDTSAFYRPGDNLPGGGTLTSVSTHEVVILRNGRRQTLTFSAPATPLFIAVPSPDSPQASAASATPSPTIENPL